MDTNIISFKKALLAVIVFSFSTAYVQPKIDFIEALSQTNDPWENMHIIFYDEYLKLWNKGYEKEYILLLLSASIESGIGSFLIKRVMFPKIFPNSQDGNFKSACTAGLACGLATYLVLLGFRPIFFKGLKINRNKQTLKLLMQLWGKNKSDVPDELHALCKKLYAEYKENVTLFFHENSGISEELHKKLICKSSLSRVSI